MTKLSDPTIQSLESQLPPELRFLSTVIDTQNDIASVGLDMTTVMRIVSSRTAKITGADGAMVEMLEDGHSVCFACSGILEPLEGTRFPVRGTLSGAAAESGEVWFCGDSESHPLASKSIVHKTGARSILVVPLQHGGSTVGILKAVALRRNAFDSRQATIMRLMAGVLATALNHAAEFEAKRYLLAERTEALAALHKSEIEYRIMFELAGVGKTKLDLRSGKFSRVNQKLCEMLGYTADELLQLGPMGITHPDDAMQTTNVIDQTIRGQVSTASFDKRYIRKDGQIIWVNVCAAAVPDNNGDPTIGLATIQDITDRKLAEFLETDRRTVLEMVAREEPLNDILYQLARALERQIQGSSAAVLQLQDGSIRAHVSTVQKDYLKVLHSHGLRLAADLSSRAWETVGSYCLTELQTFQAVPDLAGIMAKMDLHGAWALAIKSNDGTSLGLLVIFLNQWRNPTSAETQTLDMCSKLAGICIDHHNTTRKLAHLVRHDPLTGIANRVHFEDRYQHAIALAKRNGRNVGLMLIDLDRFKEINDTLGHDAGDHLLQQFAQRLNSLLRISDTMARIGGDEFAVVLPDIDGPIAALVVAEKFRQVLTEPFNVVSMMIRATASIGISLFPHHGDDAVTLLKKADQALYRVKQRGRNDFSLA